MYKLEQGIILKYVETGINSRTCDVLQLPDRFLMSNVRLPHNINWQTKPLVNSVVLVASMDDFKSVIICVLRDPEYFLELGEGIWGAKTENVTALEEGEIVLEAAGSGTANDTISGTGGALHLSNDGTINLRSGKLKEFLILGGTDDDNDGEVLLTGDNGFFESNIKAFTNTRSYYRFDNANTLQLGNEIALVTDVSEVDTPISTLSMTALGKISLQNYTGLIPNTLLEMDIDGQITLQNNFSSETFSNTGAVALNGVSLSISMSSTITQTGSTINLNNGTFGVARVQDVVTSNMATDPTFWTFWSTISTQILALPTTPLDGGATLKAGLATLFGLMPPTILSKITTGSTTVKAGG
jgi:hypothetical protein